MAKTKQKMSIHKGLAELKLIDSKIDKKIATLKATGINQKGKLVDGIYQEKEFEADALTIYQSVNDLIDRKIDIKKAIVNANAKTKVIIAGKTMTIADAITFKSIVNQKELLINKLENDFAVSKASMENNNTKIKENALKLAEAALGKDNVKIDSKDFKNITEQYIDANEAKIVDPLKVASKIKTLTEEVEDFQMEVDACLSEINAITLIEI